MQRIQNLKLKKIYKKIPFLIKLGDFQGDDPIKQFFEKKQISNLIEILQNTEDSQIVFILDDYDAIKHQKNNIFKFHWNRFPKSKVITLVNYKQVTWKQDFKKDFSPSKQEQPDESKLKVSYIQPLNDASLIKYFNKMVANDQNFQAQLQISSGQECFQFIKQQNNLLQLVRNISFLQRVTPLLQQVRLSLASQDISQNNFQSDQLGQTGQSQQIFWMGTIPKQKQWNLFAISYAFILELFKRQKQNLQAFESENWYYQFQKDFSMILVKTCYKLCLQQFIKQKNADIQFKKDLLDSIINKKSKYNNEQKTAILQAMPIIVHNQEGKEVSAEWNNNINFEFFQCLSLFRPQLQLDNEDSFIFEDKYIINSNSFNQIPIYQKAQVIDFCVNLLQTRSEQEYEDLIKGLLDLIRQSKSKFENQIAAANAISILVKAGYQFMEEDFQSVNIQNANLTNGVFFRCNFSGSSLVNCNLSDVYMQECNLQNVDLQAATLSSKKVWLQQAQLPILQAFYKKSQQKYIFSSTLNLFAFYHLVQQGESTIIKLQVLRKNGTVLFKKSIELQYQPVNEIFIQFCQEEFILLSQFDLFIFNTISSKFTSHSLDQYQRSESQISCSNNKNIKIVKRDGVYLLFWQSQANNPVSNIAHWIPSYNKLEFNQTQFYQKDLVYYQIDSISGIIDQTKQEQGLTITINQVQLDEIENQIQQLQIQNNTYQISKSKEIENSWEFEITFKYFIYVEQTDIIVQEKGAQNNLMQIKMLNNIQFVKEIDQNYLMVLSGSQQNSNKLAYIIDFGKILSAGYGQGQNVDISMYVPYADVFPFSQKNYENIKWDRETQYLYTQDSTPAWIFKFQQNKLFLKHCFGICGFSNFQNSYGELKNINQQKLELLESVGYKISKISPKLIQCSTNHQHSLEIKVKEGQNKTSKCKECQVTNPNTFLYYCKECNYYLCLNHKNQQNQFKDKINYQDQKQIYENGQFKCQICNALYNFGRVYNDQFKNLVYCEWCAEGKSYNIQGQV